MRKILTMALALLMTVCLFTAVGCADTNKHNFSSSWSYDFDTHWYQCSDQGCEEKSQQADHNYQLVGTVNTCSVCGYSYNTANTYEINLETLGGTVIAGVSVSLYNKSNQEVATAKSNVRGKVRFNDLTPDDYVAKIQADTLPKGYYLTEDTQEIQLSATTMKKTVKLPSQLIDEQMPAKHKYSVGDVAYDFKTTTVDEKGKQKNISLSAYLTQYDAVILNFWYASCNPCLAEFPHMNEAYLDYSDKVAVIAVNGGYDSPADIADFVASTGYDFDFVNDEAMFTYDDAFGVVAYPTTVVIDRYGAVAYIISGSVPSSSTWKNLFEHYTADDYQPDYLTGFEDDSNGSDELTKPDVEMPESEQIAQQITKINDYTTASTFSYLPYDDQYSWPWVLDEREGVACLKTSNKDRVNSYSILVIEVALKEGQQIMFDYFVSTEEDTDLLYVQVDTVLQYTLSGENAGWKCDQLLYVARRDGNYQITLTYQKSLMNNVGEDSVYIKNLRIEEGAEVTGHYDLLYNAVDNYTLDKNVTAPEAYKGSLNHVAYYYNESDGLYHVALSGDVNKKANEDPILLADLVMATHWNSMSVWNLAYAGAGLFSEIDPDYKEGYYQAVEDYAWMQNNCTTGYVPLNKELHDILVDVVADLGRTDNSQDAYEGKDQWLEICRYYVHYGEETDEVCKAMDNTVEALKWRVAKDYGVMTDDVMEIEVDVYSVHIPRGNYYRFQTTKAGAYKIYSLAPLGSDYDLNAQDPLGFVCDQYGNILAENDNYVIEVQGYGADENGVIQTGVSRYALYDNNFYMYVYLEANTTYYVAGCFNATDGTGKYDVKVEYLGETATYFTSCAIDPAYTYDVNDPNFTPIIIPRMGLNRFFLGDDGNYYAQEFDGSQGSLLYIRLIGPTYYSSYTSTTLEYMIENDLIGQTQAEKLYLKHMLAQARTTHPEGHELYGYVVATEQLVNILNRVANGVDTEDSSTYSQTAWLLTAYYYCNVNELTLRQAQSKY